MIPLQAAAHRQTHEIDPPPAATPTSLVSAQSGTPAAAIGLEGLATPVTHTPSGEGPAGHSPCATPYPLEIRPMLRRPHIARMDWPGSCSSKISTWAWGAWANCDEPNGGSWQEIAICQKKNDFERNHRFGPWSQWEFPGPTARMTNTRSMQLSAHPQMNCKGNLRLRSDGPGIVLRHRDSISRSVRSFRLVRGPWPR